MSIPQTFVYKELNENTAAIVDGRIWGVKERKEDDNYFRWYGKIFGVVKGKTLRALEEDYLEKHEHEIKQPNKEGGINYEDTQLADFVIKNVIGKVPYKNKRRDKQLIEEVLYMSALFACCGSLYEVNQGKNENHELRIEGKSYSIGKELTELEELERKYERKLENILTRQARYNSGTTKIIEKGRFYNQNENIGFEKTENGFFVYTVVKPYSLYERYNNKYYGFGEAKIGIKLEIVDEEIAWQSAVVINRYIHPALPNLGTYQRICTGNYSYDTLREKYDDKAKQIRAALGEAVRMIERGYFSAKGSWNKLTNSEYMKLEIKNPKEWRVTNV